MPRLQQHRATAFKCIESEAVNVRCGIFVSLGFPGVLLQNILISVFLEGCSDHTEQMTLLELSAFKAL